MKQEKRFAYYPLSLSLSLGNCEIGCSCKITRNQLEEQKDNGGYGLSLDELCPAMACQHPVSSHEQLGKKTLLSNDEFDGVFAAHFAMCLAIRSSAGDRRRRSGGESSEGSERSVGGMSR
jgi:hypothetical protein